MLPGVEEKEMLQPVLHSKAVQKLNQRLPSDVHGHFVPVSKGVHVDETS